MRGLRNGSYMISFFLIHCIQAYVVSTHLNRLNKSEEYRGGNLPSKHITSQQRRCNVVTLQ